MRKINFKKISLFIAVIGLLIFFHFIKVLRPIEDGIIFLLKPFTNSLYSVSSDIKTSYAERSEKEDLLNKIDLLEQENRQLLKQNANLEILKEENKKLREYHDFIEENKYKYVLANIVSQGLMLNSSESDNIILIDKGYNNGLSPGLAVVNSEGVIIGKINEVKSNISRVFVASNPYCKLAASIQGSDNTQGIAQGELGLTITMDYIPQTLNIAKGDLVITSGLEDMIPKGLLLGKISQVNKESNEIWQKAIIEPFIDYNNLSIVSVILP